MLAAQLHRQPLLVVRVIEAFGAPRQLQDGDLLEAAGRYTRDSVRQA